MRSRFKFFYGWVIVAGGFVFQMITGINNQGFATYLPILEREFGWSKALLSAPRSLAQVEVAILGPITGYLVDKLGPRIMISMGVGFFGVGLALFGRVDTVWSYFAVFGLMAVGSSFSSLLVVSTAINNWFRRKRTMGIGLATTGLGVSGVISIPLIVMMQDSWGWRTSAMISGVAVCLIGIPVALMMRDRPERYGLLPDGDPPQSAARPSSAQRTTRYGGAFDFTLKEALRTRAFWFISWGIALGQFALSGLAVHQFAQLESEVGLSRSSAALVIVVMSAFNIGGRLFGGFLGDRIPKRVLLGSALLGSGISILIVTFAHSLPQAMAYGIVYGSSWGVRTPVNNAIRGDYFGRSHYGRISGISQGLAAPFSVGGPVLVGLAADILGRYHETFFLLALVCFAASLLLYLAVPPAPPARLAAATPDTNQQD